MDVFEELIRDHRTIEQRIVEINQTTDKEVGCREQLFRKLRAGFEAHELFEEEILYPAIDQFPFAKSPMGDAFDEHVELDAKFQEIADTPANKTEWAERICELKDMMQEHMRMEEETIFPAARMRLAETRAEELGRQFRERTDVC